MLRSRRWFICQHERCNVLCGTWARSRLVINNPYQSHLECLLVCRELQFKGCLWIPNSSTFQKTHTWEIAHHSNAALKRFTFRHQDVFFLFHWDSQGKVKCQTKPTMCGYFLRRSCLVLTAGRGVRPCCSWPHMGLNACYLLKFALIALTEAEAHIFLKLVYFVHRMAFHMLSDLLLLLLVGGGFSCCLWAFFHKASAETPIFK